MQIFYDENMPYAEAFFADLGQLKPFNGRKLTTEQVKAADVLLVRSITQVNQQLLAENQQLSFVGTATIGVDHIDQAMLQQRGIRFYSAPGCNAVSVAEYVLSCLVVLAERYQLNLTGLTVGIVGAGNTGSRLYERLTALGIQCKLCDPPLAEQANDERDYYLLDEVLSCDVISLHVPLIKQGCNKTLNVIDAKRLSKLSDTQILINACRGEVVDNHALLSLKQAGKGPITVLDVWQNEPDILLPLLKYIDIATAHIAGYSLEGKARGTEMLYQALCQELGVAAEKSLDNYLPTPDISQVNLACADDIQSLSKVIKLVYDVRRDDALFRHHIEQKGFDWLRKNYPIRREFSSLKLVTQDQQTQLIQALGFTTED